MRLLSSIDTFIQNCSNAVATSDYKLLRRSLKAFLDGRETDVLRLAQPWFIDQFLDFLIVNYRSNKTRGHDLTHEQASTTAMRYLKTLRKYVNHLIAVGEFPDLDIFEGTKLAHHFKRQRRKAPSPILTLELDPSSKRLVSPTAMKAAVQMAAGWDFFLCGADPLTLADDDFDDASRKIFLRPFNLAVEYPEEIYGRLKRLKGIPAQQSTGLVPLLNFIISNKLAANPRRLITLWLATNKKPDNTDAQMLKRLVEVLSQRCNPYHRNWYAIKTFGRTAQDLAECLLQPNNGISELLTGNPADIYVPYLPPPQISTKRSLQKPHIIDRHAVLKHTLFVRVCACDIGKFAMQLPGAYVYQRRGSSKKEYLPIPYSEIRTLQLVLLSMGAKQDSIDSGEDKEVLAPGTIVEVHIPDFEGYKAEVVKRNSDGTYILVIRALSYKISLTRIPAGLIVKC